MTKGLLVLIQLIPSLAIIIAAVCAVYLFRKQQRFKRLQDLSSLWKEFVNNEANMHLFNLMNELESGNTVTEDVSQISTVSKLNYLALIEEVAVYIENFEIDKSYARYLFQWHFYFVYHSKIISDLIWKNLGVQQEMNESYWSKSRELSKEFVP